MIQALFIILAIIGISTASVQADTLAEPSAAVDSTESIKENESTQEEAPATDDLYSNPANDPNLLSEENEGRLKGHEFGRDNIKQIMDYSEVSERYPSTVDEE